MIEKKYNWKRFWCPRGGTINLSDGGYLFDPDSEWGSVYNPDVRSFDAISRAHCLILLGEPGVGKSAAMKAEYDVVHGGGKLALLRDLKAYQTDIRLKEGVFDNRIVRDWVTGLQDLHLFLDSFDECSIRKDTLGALLIELLQPLPRARLFIHIACRTADWPHSFEQGLIELWGQENVGAYELAPLRRADVQEAAQANGIDPLFFFREVADKNVIPFAIKPVTLGMLLNLFSKGQHLPKTQAEIYLQGCGLLCEETNPSRAEAKLTGKFTSMQRLTVAARIAAISIYARRYAIWTDIDRGNVPEEDVTIRELIGSKESVNGEPFEVTKEAIEETLATGLFTSRGPHRLGWAHQSYAEFLAAHYLQSHQFTPGQIRSLIFHPDDPSHHLVPQLHQTAAWLATLSLQVAREIMGTDPDVLLQGDVSTADNQLKEELVTTLLDLYDKEALREKDIFSHKHYQKLYYAGLAAQLTSFITDKMHSPVTRRVAIDIAEECKLQEIEDVLVDVCLDPSELYGLRTNAAYAVGRIGSYAAKARLKPLALGQAGDDPDDELKGCGLLAIWPAHLTAEELFATLTAPKQDNFIGAYNQFLRHEAIEGLKPEQLPTALKWVAEHPRLFSELVDRVMVHSLRHLDAPDVLDAFVKAVVVRARLYDDILGDESIVRRDDDSIPNPYADDALRRKVLAAIIPYLASEGEEALFRLADARTPLVNNRDVTWLLDQLAEGQPEETYKVIAELIWRVIDRSNSAQMEAVFFSGEKYPVLGAKFAPFFRAIELNSPEAETLKKRYLQMIEWERKREERARYRVEPLPAERIAIRLDQFESGDIKGWWILVREMSLEPTSTHYRDEEESDLTSLPGWKSADLTTRARIVMAAKRYLLQGEPNSEHWLGKDIIYFPALAGFKALRLLLSIVPEELTSIPSDIWKKWALAIVAYPARANEAHQVAHRTLTRMLHEREPEEALDALLAVMNVEGESSVFFSVIKGFEDCWDSRLESVLLGKAKELNLMPAYFEHILKMLIRHKADEAIQLAESLLVLPLPTDEDKRQKAFIAAHALVENAPDAGWATVWPVIQTDLEFSQRLIASIADRHDLGESKVLQRLSERETADLYILLSHRYPHSEDPNSIGYHAITPREDIAQWRDAALYHLVSLGNAQACEEIVRIVQELPHLPRLRLMLLEARAITRRNTWIPCRPSEILKLAADKRRQLVQNGEQLLEVIIESLGRLQEKLQGEIPQVSLLWNKLDANTWRPKEEETLSDYVASHLKDDLRQKGIIANREVAIRRGMGNAPGEKVDVHVDAIALDPYGKEIDIITVIVEAKGCWHTELLAAMQTQLIDRYLKENQCQHGLYLVGWYNCPQWADTDYRKKGAMKYGRDSLRQYLEAQAQQLSQNKITVKTLILDAALR